MNFLDAHKIVHDYAGSVGKGSDPNALGRPINYLLNSKDEIVDAFKLFFAHMFFFATRTPEQYEQYYLIFKKLNEFVELNQYLDTIECLKIEKSKGLFKIFRSKDTINFAHERLKKYMDEYTDKMLNPYRIDEFDAFNSKVLDKAKEIKTIINEEISNNLDLRGMIEDYCEYIYSIANINYTEADFPFFNSFEQMRIFLKDPILANFFKGYENYILEHQ